ncbi:hypothetical protein [uncultured Serinicoccus sp.]|uniref:hypothetical protein n=1 Tax=uncultured Serinicoccus sp. TaxID=735514 RepID=UPI002612581B|nr:hypothetical protein [uncultured Serinicoccus sp.]
MATNGAVLDSVGPRCSYAQRVRSSLVWMLDFAKALSARGLEDVFPTFESHAEGFLSRASVPAVGAEPLRMRNDWGEDYQRLRPALHALLERSRNEGFSQYGSLLDGQLSSIVKVIGAEGGDYPPGLGATTIEPGKNMSQFHRDLLGDTRWRHVVPGSLHFETLRFAVNVLYYDITRSGVRFWHRYWMAFMLARLGEEITGQSALDRIRSIDSWAWPDGLARLT